VRARKTTWYVGTAGNDSNTGLDSTRAFATVAKANSVVQPGDTVYFLPGTYRNATYGDGNIWKDPQDLVVRINNVHGTAAAPITYAAAPGAHVTLQYDGGGGFRITNSEYIRIEGFDVAGPNQIINLAEASQYQFAYRLPGDTTTHFRDPAEDLSLATSSTGGKSIASLGGTQPTYYHSQAIAIGNNANHIEIVGNSVHDSPGYGISSLGGADYITIRGSTVYNNVGGVAAITRSRSRTS
jgi:hypothetical protein